MYDPVAVMLWLCTVRSRGMLGMSSPGMESLIDVCRTSGESSLSECVEQCSSRMKGLPDNILFHSERIMINFFPRGEFSFPQEQGGNGSFDQTSSGIGSLVVQSPQQKPEKANRQQKHFNRLTPSPRARRTEHPSSDVSDSH